MTDQQATATDGTTASASVEIVNLKGLHARASAKFVKCAETFDADISVSANGNEVPGTSIMGLLMLAACPGTMVQISATGIQARDAVDALVALVTAKFDEDS